MAANKSYDDGPFNITATNFGSTYHEAFLNLSPRDFNATGYIEFGNMSGNGQLTANISFASKSTVHDTWSNTLTFDTLSATSAADQVFYSSADDQVKPLLPIARVRITAAAKSSGSVTFTDVLCKLLVED